MERILSPDGTPIAFQTSGNGPPLVLVHGAAGDHGRWDMGGVREALAAHRTLYAMDRRGRGQSGDAPEYRLDLEFEDVAAVVRSIEAPVDLLGHSYGALCALEAALRVDNLRRLVLYEPPIPMGIEPVAPADAVTTMERLLDDGDPEGALIFFLLEIGRLSQEEVDLMRRAPSWPGRVGAAHTLVREERAADGYRFEAGRFQAMTTPTLLLTGSESGPFYAAATEAVAHALPDSRVVVFEGEMHVAMNTAPELFLREVQAFLG